MSLPRHSTSPLVGSHLAYCSRELTSRLFQEVSLTRRVTPDYMAHQTVHWRKFSNFRSEMPEWTDEAQYLFSLSKVFSQWNEKSSQTERHSWENSCCFEDGFSQAQGSRLPPARGRDGVWCQ